MELKRRKRTFGGIVFGLLAIGAAVSLLIAYLALYLDPAEHPVVMFFGLYFIPLLLLNLLFLLLAIFRHPRVLLIPLVAILPFLLLADRFLKFGRDEVEPESAPLKVLTYNLGRYSAGGRRISVEQAMAGIRKSLSEQDADIVCLQEVAVTDTSELRSCLPGYPYQARHLFPGKRWFGNVTLSKYPIVAENALTFPESRNLSLVTDIDAGGRMLRIYNCHLESYSISFTSLVKRLFNKETFTDEVIQVHGRLREATRRRSAQVAALLEDEQQSIYPAFLCGDFNDSPLSYTYQQLTRTKKDSFVEAGVGMGGSYVMLWPLLRIDYLLLPQDYTAVDYETLRVRWSDHYPVMTTVYY